MDPEIVADKTGGLRELHHRCWRGGGSGTFSALNFRWTVLFHSRPEAIRPLLSFCFFSVDLVSLSSSNASAVHHSPRSTSSTLEESNIVMEVDELLNAYNYAKGAMDMVGLSCLLSIK
jgi:hypothetical protein